MNQTKPDRFQIITVNYKQPFYQNLLAVIDTENENRVVVSYPERYYGEKAKALEIAEADCKSFNETPPALVEAQCPRSAYFEDSTGATIQYVLLEDSFHCRGDVARQKGDPLPPPEKEGYDFRRELEEITA